MEEPRFKRSGLNIVGPRIKALRVARGWSQLILAAHAAAHDWPISRDMVANFELGRTRVDDAALRHLAEILGVEIKDLFPKSH